MSNDPRYPGDDDDEDENNANKKTRLVMRPDMTEPGGAEPPRGGSVIGTTRLVGVGNFPQAGGGAGGYSPGPGAPTAKMGGSQAKTQYVREGSVDTSEPVAGWIVVLKGPGRGGFRPVFVGMNSVGRAPSQRICLDFGDDSISREEHAFITYDDESRTFYLQHGGKSNLVRLGGKPVLQPTELKPNDQFRIGNTTFRFVACCGPDFNWSDEVQDG